ncbi:hypothetical protein [Nonomuraea sp. NPDC049400]|uniref:hypothetical protein n=1 Tax=Nonomuraea sp. NPDC049400 TaxID=3364352 RepID=UPI00379E9167
MRSGDALDPCLRCGAVIAYSGNGRYARFCNAYCRKSYHRQQAQAGRVEQPRMLPGMPRLARSRRAPAPPPPPPPLRPAALNRQIPLFDRPMRDLTRYDAELHAELDNPALILARSRAAQIGQERGWSAYVRYDVDRSLPMLLSGHIDGDQIPEAEVLQLTGFNLPARRVAAVLADLDLLTGQRPPAIEDWIVRQTADLPAGFASCARDWLFWLHNGDTRTKPRSDATIYTYFGLVRPYLIEWGHTHDHLREITKDLLLAAMDKLGGRRHHNVLTALKSLFRYAKKDRKIFTNPTQGLRTTRTPAHSSLVPLQETRIQAAADVADTATLRLIIGLAAIHAARPVAIRHLKISDVDLANQRITLNGVTRPLDEFTAQALLAYLRERARQWPHTKNPHVLVSRITAGGQRPVSKYFPKQHLLRHGIQLEEIRMDRVLDEALANRADPLHLACVFGFDATTAVAYAEAARRILTEDHLSLDVSFPDEGC